MSSHEQTFFCRAPSNIALFKYWGKDDTRARWPSNSSLSMTLAECTTLTSVLRSEQDVIFHEGHRVGSQDSFGQRVRSFLDIVRENLETDSGFIINTSNSFPSAAGIASSASGFAALTIACVAAITGATNLDELENHGWCRQRLSGLARLGSGSACRSLWGGFVEWERGLEPAEQRCKTLDNKLNLSDTIVIFDSKPKQVSSSQGHSLASSSPLFRVRIAGCAERLRGMKLALERQDWELAGILMEEEALSMHAIMLTAAPATRYFTAETIDFLAWLRRIRETEGLATYFTLDAGPNVHILGLVEDSQRLREMIKRDFPGRRMIQDRMGSGPELWSGS